MSYIHFDKTQLINLNYSLDREIIRTNRGGSYTSTTIIGCNTRKYHGLLVSPQPQIDSQLHVLLSSETPGVGVSERVNGAPVIVDGQKTDGVDSLYKELRGIVAVSDSLTKAHGRAYDYDYHRGG